MSGADFIERIRHAARGCGYAVAVHGSQKRDLDLVAVPWTPEAVSAQRLVDVLCTKLPLSPRRMNFYGDQLPARVEPNPELKPWGRLAWALDGVPGGTGWRYVDLSVAPRAGEAVPAFITAGYRDSEREAIRREAEFEASHPEVVSGPSDPSSRGRSDGSDETSEGL